MAKDTIEDQTNKVFAKKEIEPDLLDRVTDFFSRERGLERSEKLEDAIRYYLGPYAGSLGQANQLLNPIVGLQDAGEATREGRYVDAVTDTAAAALPIAGALAAKPLAKSVQSGIDEAVDAVTEVMTGGTFDKGRREVLGTMVAAPVAVAAGSTGIMDELIAPLAKKTVGSGTLSASIAKLKGLEADRILEQPRGQEIYKRVRDNIYQNYYDVMGKSPELIKHEEKMRGLYKSEEEEYIKNLYPLTTKENLTKLSNQELEEVSNKIQMSVGNTPISRVEASESGLDIFENLVEKLNLLKEEYIRRDYNPVHKYDFEDPITAIEELDQAIFFAKYPEAEGIEDYEKFITSGTIPSFPDVLNKMTPANSPSEPKIISFSKKQEDKKLQEFSKKLSSTIAERASKMGELVEELKEAGIYGDYNVGAVVQGKNYKGDPRPFTVEGQSLQKVKLNNPTLKRIEDRLGMKFNYIEKDGDYYIAMLNTSQKDADGITRSQVYLDAVKHREYPVLSGPTGSVPKEFNKGGTAMKDQMEMNFGEAETVDPVSGNDVPPGSLPEEVRDDIPARLSEGEYVVPADVVRYYGVKFFEDLRTQAKMGLQQMDADGRIGGEPIEPQQAELSDDDLNSIIEQAMQQEQPMMANEGGVVGYKHGGYHPPDFLGMSVFGDKGDKEGTPYEFYDPDVGGYKPTAGDYGTTTPEAPTVTANVPDPVCPPGPNGERQRYDKSKGMCVPVSEGPTTEPEDPKPSVPFGSDFNDGKGVNWVDPTDVLKFAKTFDTGMISEDVRTGAGLATAFIPGAAPLAALGVLGGKIDATKDVAGLKASRIISAALGQTENVKQIGGILEDYEKKFGDGFSGTFGIGTGLNYAASALGVDRKDVKDFIEIYDSKGKSAEEKLKAQKTLEGLITNSKISEKIRKEKQEEAARRVAAATAAAASRQQILNANAAELARRRKQMEDSSDDYFDSGSSYKGEKTVSGAIQKMKDEGSFRRGGRATGGLVQKRKKKK